LQERVGAIRTRLQDAIFKHDFEKGRAISDEEGAEHDKLISLYRQHRLPDWIYDKL
jgi:hypothetical protein